MNARMETPMNTINNRFTPAADGGSHTTAPRAWSFELSLVVLLPALAVCASLVSAYVAYVKGFTEAPTAITATHGTHR